MKLGVEILSDNTDPMELLKLLAKEKFKASDIHRIENTDKINIDAGINDIRAEVEEDNVLLFFIRYKTDESYFRNIILEFCREQSLSVRFR